MKSTELLSWLQSAKGSVDQERARTEEDKCGRDAGANSGYFGSTSEAPRTTASNNKRHKPVRRYDENYIKFGFIWSEREEEPRCVVCGDVLSNECMKPSHLKWHLSNTKTLHLMTNQLIFFFTKT